MSDSIIRLADKLAAATSVSVLTGAGVSAASGIPTFRGDEGLWKSYRPERLATPEAFAANPRLVWEWYDWRRQMIAGCQPNRAHEVLAAWSHRFENFGLITQNVDGLHERAGTASVTRFHGSVWEVLCWTNCVDSPDRWIDETVPFSPLPPPCPHCDGIIRPGVVWFGEGISPPTLERTTRALTCEVFLTIGTSAVVYPAAALGATARARGAFTAEINLDTTPSSGQFDISIQGCAELLLDKIDSLLPTGD